MNTQRLRMILDSIDNAARYWMDTQDWHREAEEILSEFDNRRHCDYCCDCCGET